VKHSHQADHYRGLAADCARRAAQAKTAPGREQWGLIASRYLDLADQLEKLEDIEPQATSDPLRAKRH
jgi:hypothetical protein